MWAKHWREVLKYLQLCLHVFSGSVSCDVTASAHKSLLQWLLEQYAFFFFLHILTQYTHMLTKIYIYICAYAQAETNTEWLSSVFYLLNQFSKLQYCSLFLFKMPKAIFPTFLFLLQGCQALTKLGKLNCLGWAPPPWITLSWMSFWRSGGQLIH